MSDSEECVKNQTQYKNLEGVHFTVHASRANIHKVSSTASLRKHDHISHKSSFFNENDLFVHKTPSLSSLRLGKIKSHLSIKSVKSRRASLPNQPQFEQSTLQPKNLSSMKYNQEYWSLPLRKFHDEADILSSHPSFTIKNVSYSLECHQRYQKARTKYNAQLRREMGKYVSLTQRVADQYSTRCFLSYSTFWPPLHTTRELEIFNRQFLKLTEAEQKRLNFLMTTELSYA